MRPSASEDYKNGCLILRGEPIVKAELMMKYKTKGFTYCYESLPLIEAEEFEGSIDQSKIFKINPTIASVFIDYNDSGRYLGPHSFLIKIIKNKTYEIQYFDEQNKVIEINPKTIEPLEFYLNKIKTLNSAEINRVDKNKITSLLNGSLFPSKSKKIILRDDLNQEFEFNIIGILPGKQ